MYIVVVQKREKSTTLRKSLHLALYCLQPVNDLKTTFCFSSSVYRARFFHHRYNFISMVVFHRRKQNQLVRGDSTFLVDFSSGVDSLIWKWDNGIILPSLYLRKLPWATKQAIKKMFATQSDDNGDVTTLEKLYEAINQESDIIDDTIRLFH